MEKKLERDQDRKMIAGVAAGLATYLNVEVVWIRILFICLAVFGFSGLIIYLLMWVAVPKKPFAFQSFNANYQTDADSDFTFQTNSEKPGKGRFTAGLILIMMGVFFLMNEFIDLPDWFSLEKLWPLIFIAIGLLILLKPGQRKKQHQFFDRNSNTKQASKDQPSA